MANEKEIAFNKLESIDSGYYKFRNDKLPFHLTAELLEELLSPITLEVVSKEIAEVYYATRQRDTSKEA